MQSALSKWQREITSFRGIKSTFIIEGNINDLHVVENPQDGEVSFENLNETIYRIFNPVGSDEVYDMLFCDPLFGFSDPLNQGLVKDLVTRYQEAAIRQRDETQAFSGSVASDSASQISEIIRAAITKPDSVDTSKPVAVVINFASRLVSSPGHMSGAEIMMFLNLLFASKNAIRAGSNIKTLVMVVDKFNDIPAWFYLNNPNVRTVCIPNPDRAVRESFVNSYFSDLSGDDPALGKIKTKFIDLTEGVKLLEIDELRRLYIKSSIPIEEISDTISIYKFGFKENKWESMRSRIEGDPASVMRRRVKGQQQAIEKMGSNRL
ncbi:MAG: hypothetical protein FWB75_01735 [Oscillospiraceae bacterium]|nr:hypothetical protein [Oscillospiraceae bacterium]